MIHSYEDMGVTFAAEDRPPLLEAYSGEQIVAWWGNIERQLQRMIDKYEDSRNSAYVDKLRAYLQTWRENQISGSINRETLDPIESSANLLSVDSWKLNNYFGNLRDQIRKLIASEEQLPRTPSPADRKPPRPSGGPPPSSFGPGAGGEEDAPPPGDEPDEGGDTPPDGDDENENDDDENDES